ncbi:putative B3 domain-containing protein At2g27410 [Mercurialis annua]|uniref:putative B3 domain-containing protein At2g27410 n=1 Tax=Mercurialis annua TaxID=3986 RepID=UPI0024ACC5B7|nr:putative B3 domain-containing protein At2g27410 [Mercurialis annua]
MAAADANDEQDWLPLAAALMNFNRIFTRRRNREEEEEEKVKKINNKRVKICKTEEKEEEINITTVIIPCELQRKITEKGGTEPKLVMTKKVTRTDLSSNHGCLSMPAKQLSDRSFIDDDEREVLEYYEELYVMFMEPCGEDSAVVMKKWDYANKKGYKYILRRYWNDIVSRNCNREFKENDMIQIWSFRVHGVLWLTLFKVLVEPKPKPEPRGEDGASTSHSTVSLLEPEPGGEAGASASTSHCIVSVAELESEPEPGGEDCTQCTESGVDKEPDGVMQKISTGQTHPPCQVHDAVSFELVGRNPENRMGKKRKEPDGEEEDVLL